MGLSLGHTGEVLKLGFGFQASRAGISRAVARMAGKVEPTYQELLQMACASPVNGVDESRWSVGARSTKLCVAIATSKASFACKGWGRPPGGW
jgi:hypothetical protein